MIVKKAFMLALAGILALALALLASLMFGSRTLAFSDVIEIVFQGQLFQDTSGILEAQVIRERIPRTIFALIAGASLGVSGSLMQSITRNPIADPGILGVNTGASLFVVVGLAFFHIQTKTEYIWLALLGSAITAVVVYLISSIGRGGTTPLKLALSGAACSAALSSLVSVILLPRTEALNHYRFWQVGSLSGASYEDMITMSFFLVPAFLLALLLLPYLDAMALGDDMATGLGVHPLLIRLLAALSAVILCGTTTALAGPIAFVGLMIPHVIRLVLGPSMKLLVPYTALFGALILLVADVIGRVLGSPGELEAGIITTFLGAPILIMIARRTKVREL
jgi:iron complex transport system permease protein